MLTQEKIQEFNFEATLLCDLKSTITTIRYNFIEFFKKLGYSFSYEQFRVLTIIYRQENFIQKSLKKNGEKYTGISQKELLTNSMLGKANLAQLLNKIEKNKWIIRHQDPNDHRRLQILLTKSGKLFYEKVFNKVYSKIIEIENYCVKEDVEITKRVLNQISQKLKYATETNL